MLQLPVTAAFSSVSVIPGDAGGHLKLVGGTDGQEATLPVLDFIGVTSSATGQLLLHTLELAPLEGCECGPLRTRAEVRKSPRTRTFPTAPCALCARRLLQWGPRGARPFEA